MLYSRIIPCLLVKNRGLVKTKKFKDPKYVGDPINAVKIFNEKEADELIVLDIDATLENREPDYKMIENLAVECRMPLCYGGGIKNSYQARKVFGLGVEKIAVSSIALEKPEIVTKIADQVGTQSVVVILDVRKKRLGNRYEIWIKNGKKNTGKCPIKFAQYMEQLGAGEIVVNSIDNDGEMNGYDMTLIEQVHNAINIPLTVLGGAGSNADIKKIFLRYRIIGAAAGSLFVFKGKYRAVLINYPKTIEKDELLDFGSK